MKPKIILLIAFCIQIIAANAQGTTMEFDTKGRLTFPGEIKPGSKIITKVKTDILIEDQKKALNKLNKKWKNFADSLNGACEGFLDTLLIDSKHFAYNGMAYSPVKGFFEIRENLDTGPILLETVSDTSTPGILKIECELQVKNLVYENILLLRNHLLEEIKKSERLALNKLRPYSRFQQILQGDLGFFDCCDDNTTDIKDIISLTDCVPGVSEDPVQPYDRDINNKIMKLYFIENLLSGTDANDIKLQELKQKKLAIERHLEKIEKSIVDSLEKWVTIAADTNAAKKVKLGIAANDSLKNRIKRELYLINYQIKDLSGQKKEKPTWSKYLVVHKANIQLALTPVKDRHQRVYDDSRQLSGHLPLVEKTYYNESHSFLITVINISSGELSIDTVMGPAIEEQTLLADGIGNIPGLTDMLSFITGWSAPSIIPVLKGNSIKMDAKEANTVNAGAIMFNGYNSGYSKELEKALRDKTIKDSNSLKKRLENYSTFREDYETLKKITITDPSILKYIIQFIPPEDTCCCCWSICKEVASICINGEYYKVPAKLYIQFPELQKGLCLGKCELMTISMASFLHHYLSTGMDNKTNWLERENSPGSTYYSTSKSFSLSKAGARDVKFVLKNPEGKEVETLETISVSRLYRITAAVGGIYQNGYPYELQLNSSNTFDKVYLDKLAFTGGIKIHFRKTSLREPLVFKRNSGLLNIRGGTLWSKTYLYLGVTLSTKPYEHLFLGFGLEVYPGLSLVCAQRFSWINRYVNQSGNFIQTSGYSKLGAPGSIGLGILIDPKVAVQLFKKQ